MHDMNDFISFVKENFVVLSICTAIILPVSFLIYKNNLLSSLFFTDDNSDNYSLVFALRKFNIVDTFENYISIQDGSNAISNLIFVNNNIFEFLQYVCNCGISFDNVFTKLNTSDQLKMYDFLNYCKSVFSDELISIEEKKRNINNFYKTKMNYDFQMKFFRNLISYYYLNR